MTSFEAPVDQLADGQLSDDDASVAGRHHQLLDHGERGSALDSRRQAPDRRSPAGWVPLLELRPGDRACLAEPEGEGFTWSAPVTIRSVVLVDTGLAEVRWEAGPGDDPWPAHALLLGPSFDAGALRIG